MSPQLLQRSARDLVALARTGAAAAGLGTAAGLGLVAGVVNRSRRQGANVAFSAGSDLTLALAGVELRVTGAEHLWSHRPAVFVFNHQSALDALVVGNLLRRDITGVAKREAAHDPRFALFGALGGMVYVDRTNHAQAVSALHQVVERIEAGVSVAIAPEGTRTRTGALGPFKKGAFRLAMEAAVPIVPIVIRNTRDLMPRGSALLRPGTVDVAVLPPIDPSGWAPDDLEKHVDGVQGLFEDTLASWPRT
jgi:putative phosphoserine phosphatase/1-acylglycerol-3-phosphate O-acyltransferase